MPKPTAAANAAPMPAAMSGPSLFDLEGTICDLALAAELIREGLVEAEPGAHGAAVISEAVHWGALQLVDRAIALRAELYGFIPGQKGATNA